MARENDTALGDVSFAVPGGHVVVFARGNLVFVVRRAERAEVPVRDVAERLDRLLISPVPAQGKVAPDIRSFRLHAADPTGMLARIEIEAEDQLGRPIWSRVSAPGEVWMDTGELFVHAKGERDEEVAITAFNENGGAAEVRAGLPHS